MAQCINNQVNSYVEYSNLMSFATATEKKKMSFEEAVSECQGRPASEFFDELRCKVKEHYQNA